MDFIAAVSDYRAEIRVRKKCSRKRRSPIREYRFRAGGKNCGKQYHRKTERKKVKVRQDPGKGCGFSEKYPGIDHDRWISADRT